MREDIVLQRDCDAVLIPSGTPVSLRAGEQAVLTQALGGTYTLMVHGNLVRIAQKDADALGYDPKELSAVVESEKKSFVDLDREDVLEACWDQLKTCFDPEIPVNIVDLGLIYEVKVTEQPESGFRAQVEMTLTAPACGMGPVLVQDVTEKLNTVQGVTEVFVELVFDPPWDQSRMTEVAQLQLGMF